MAASKPPGSPAPHKPRHATVHLHVPHVRVPSIGARSAGIAAAVVALAAAGTLGAASAARTSKAKPASPVATARKLPQLPLTPQMLSRGAPPGARLLPFRPVHVAHPAPATKSVISGLAVNGIPNVALNAYRLAAVRMASAEPSCGIEWPLLAAIGRVESDHGQFGGAVLYPNGNDLPPIIGIPLDGIHAAYVAATDGGRLDGDPRYAHAVGPMQFIPSTWAAWGVDGNGDGVASPFNIDDAALTAARYLCAAGGNLRTHAGQVEAVLAYNDSDQYLAQVLALAAAYAAGVSVEGLPIVGPTSGAIPAAPRWTGVPVNPAQPPAGVASTGPAPKPHPASRGPGHARGAPGQGSTSAGQPTTPAPAGALPSTPAAGRPTAVPLPTRVPPAPSLPSLPRLPTRPVTSVVSSLVCTVNVLGIKVCSTPPTGH